MHQDLWDMARRQMEAILRWVRGPPVAQNNWGLWWDVVNTNLLVEMWRQLIFLFSEKLSVLFLGCF